MIGEASADGEAAWPGDDPRWEDEAATVAFGPPRRSTLPRPPADRPRGWRRWARAAAAIGTVGVAIALWPNPIEPAPTPRPAHPDTTPTTSPCPPTAAGAHELSSATVQTVAVSGTPCPWFAHYDRANAVLDLADRGRYRLGEPGDVLVVGDWDCDGHPTPALYRPADGRLFRFSAWPDGTAATSAAAERLPPGGRPIVHHRVGCDRVIIEQGADPP